MVHGGSIRRCSALLILVVALWLHWQWNYKLNIILNLVTIAEQFAFSVFPIDRVDDNSHTYILNYRRLMDRMPLPIWFTGDVSVEEIDLTETADYMNSQLSGLPEYLDTPVGIRFQIYRPLSDSSSNQLPPVIVYLHGGGFVFGGFDSHAHITSELATQSGFVVIVVDYRLAPEHKFPTAHLDCIASVIYVFQHADHFGVDGNRLIVAGDSAGGNLAAVVSQQLPSMVKYQVLIYPCLPSGSFMTPSFIDGNNNCMLNMRRMHWFYQRYFRRMDDLKSPLACPLNFRGNWSTVPPGMVITAEFDVLRDEGELLAATLEKRGGVVTAVRYNNTVHAFAGVVYFTHGTQVIRDISTKLLQLF
jgi:acetyl esterase